MQVDNGYVQGAKNIFLDGKEVVNPDACPTNVIKMYSEVCGCAEKCGLDISLVTSFTIEPDQANNLITIEPQFTAPVGLTFDKFTYTICDQSGNTQVFSASDLSDPTVSDDYPVPNLTPTDEWTISIFIKAADADGKKCEQILKSKVNPS